MNPQEAPPRTTADILADAERTLRIAKEALTRLSSEHAEQHLPALCNVIVFGRAVTNVLQNLKSTVQGFEEWYQPYVKEMGDDPLLRYLYKLRSKILKEGSLPTSMHLHIKHLNWPADSAQFGPPPPNAGAFIFGDRHGGSGWMVSLPDGGSEMYYAALPSEIGSLTFHLRAAPDKHLGQQLPDKRALTIAQKYVAYLDNMVRAANKHFW